MEISDANPIARSVAVNVRQLRRERGLGLAELGYRLDDVGRPLSVKVLSKMENHARGIDVDDLVAFAAALDVTVERLLAPPALTADHVADLYERWRQAQGARVEAMSTADAAIVEATASLADAIRDDDEARAALEEVLRSRFREGSHWPADVVDMILKEEV
jgi:transcriptional regulator with XRE-family HTH domain